MTFLENLEPLLKAVEQYADMTRLRSEAVSGKGLSNVIVQQNQAATDLLKAAIEFAKWGKKR